MARANLRASALNDQIRGRPARTFSPMNRRWVMARDGSIYHYGYFDPSHDMLSSLSVYRLVPDGWKLLSITYAATAEYRGGWVGRKGWQQDFASKSAWRTFAATPLELEPPDYFETEETDAEAMTAAQLRHHIDELSASGFNVVPASVELQRKFAFPFVTLVMTLLAVPFGVTTGRRGALYGIGLGIVIALSYWFTSSVFIAIGSAGILPPALAAWTPNIIVLACAVYMLLRTKT